LAGQEGEKDQKTGGPEREAPAPSVVAGLDRDEGEAGEHQ
jgi:hypothetical protein